MTILSALTRCSRPSPAATATVCSSTKRGGALEQRHPVARKLVRTTSISRATTWWLRRERSSMVMSLFHPVALPVEVALGQARQVQTASRKDLEGMVPVLTHTPPTTLPFSTTAERFPSFAAAMAAR